MGKSDEFSQRPTLAKRGTVIAGDQNDGPSSTKRVCRGSDPNKGPVAGCLAFAAANQINSIAHNMT